MGFVFGQLRVNVILLPRIAIALTLTHNLYHLCCYYSLISIIPYSLHSALCFYEHTVQLVRLEKEMGLKRECS